MVVFQRKYILGWCCLPIQKPKTLCHDFGIKAEWHFSATYHGKGACDGLGGTVKRLAAKASLQRPYEDQIMMPFQLYEWASKNIPSVTFVYCTTEEYEREKSFLEVVR